MRRFASAFRGTSAYQPQPHVVAVLGGCRRCSFSGNPSDDSGQGDAPALTKKRTVSRPRRIVPTDDDDMLHNDIDALLDEGPSNASSKWGAAQQRSGISTTIEPLMMRRMTPAEERRMRERGEDDDEEIEGGDDSETSAVEHTVSSDGRRRAPGGLAGHSTPRDPLLHDDEAGAVDGALRDPLLGGEAEQHPSEGQESADAASMLPGRPPETLAEYLGVYASALDPSINRCASMPMELVVEHTVAYMRATVNSKVVSAAEESLLFPVLFHNMHMLSADALLDIVESHWARSTLVRHGTLFKDAARDRIGSLAAELTPAQVLRTILVMGMSAGRRKRDLEFFQVFGRLFTVYVNEYKDPNDLVRVLTAFARAKIVPPPSFLAMVGRRLPVLCKTIPLEPLPCYRVMINLFKMGYDQMNVYRFLADRIFDHMDEKIKAEKKRVRVALKKEELSRSLSSSSNGNDASATTGNVLAKPAMGDENLVGGDASASPSSAAAAAAKTEIPKKAPSKGVPDAAIFASWLSNVSSANQQQLHAGSSAVGPDMQRHHPTEVIFSQGLATQKFFLYVTGLKPVHFTKLLLVLARFGAPHQQYLRPLIDPIITPAIPHLNPPTFARLLRVVAIFKSTDTSIITPLVQQLIALGPHRVLVQDVFEMLKILASPDTAIPPNFPKFVAMCAELFADFARLRASDMCTVASDLLRIQLKEDVDLETMEPLGILLDGFAERLMFLMELGVLSLTHAEVYVELCEKMHHPDREGKVALLKARRREINQGATSEGEDGEEDAPLTDVDASLPVNNGDEKYYSRLDVDVRETFHKVQIVNNWNTYGNFRPLPGVLQVDFRKALANVSAECILETAHLFDQAYPSKLILPVRRLMSRALLAKFDAEGEEIFRDDNTIEMRQNPEMLFTRSALKKFSNMLQVTPLERVRKDPRVWTMVRVKASKLRMTDVVERAETHLSGIVQKHALDAAPRTSP